MGSKLNFFFYFQKFKQRQYQKFKYLSVDRLSPCSNVSCLSDSDLSELDLVEYHSELTYSKNKGWFIVFKKINNNILT